MPEDLDKTSHRPQGFDRSVTRAEQEKALALASLLQQATRGLEPDSLVLKAQIDAVSGTLFDFLSYFAQRIEDRKLKPWGRNGRRHLVAAIDALVAQCDFEHWLRCEHCDREFIPRRDNALIDKFLAYYQQQLEWSQMCRCEDCGGLPCEEINDV